MAAGLGFKTFTTGEVLTAADVNGYLMQGLLVFANAAARDAAITSPQEGQACYLKDTDAVLTYSGTAWVGFDDSNAIQNSIINAKGDLIAGSANDTPAILAAGNNGETLVADSAATTGLRWQGNYAAGKNAIINGDMNIWQRATSFAVGNAGPYYGAADRWRYYHNGATAGTNTVSRQTFTVGQTDVPNNPTYFQRWTATTVAASQTVCDFDQLIENVSTFAGQTVTASVYLKSSGSFTYTIFLEQNFGSGGSSAVATTVATGTTTTGWVRVSGTVSVPSITGKTVGTGSSLRFLVRFSNPTSGATFDISNAQVELGNTATAFQTATGTLQGELAACRRYYVRFGTGSNYTPYGFGWNATTSAGQAVIILPVSMRVEPTSVDYSALSSTQLGAAEAAITTVTLNGEGGTDSVTLGTASSAAFTTGFFTLTNKANAAGYLALNAEL